MEGWNSKWWSVEGRKEGRGDGLGKNRYKGKELIEQLTKQRRWRETGKEKRGRVGEWWRMGGGEDELDLGLLH